jgi:hypothetical protein
MFELIESPGPGNVLGIRAGGKLTKADYDLLLPRLRDRIDRWGTIRVLLKMERVTGIEPSALWEEVRFDVKELHHVERLAVVGDAAWEKWLVTVSKPFVRAEARFFDVAHEQTAWRWLAEDA